MFGLEKSQRNLMIQQICQSLVQIAEADIQFEVLIGAGKVNQSSIHGNDMANGLAYMLDCVRGWGCWHPQTSSANEWIQLSFQNPKEFLGVVTQGRAHHHDHWVKKYEVEYSSNGLQWTKVEPLTNSMQAQLTYQKNSFYGNNDRNTKVTNYFKKSFSARTVRILPIEFNGHPCLRFDFLTNKTN